MYDIDVIPVLTSSPDEQFLLRMRFFSLFFLQGLMHKVLILDKFLLKLSPDLKPGLTCSIILLCWINYANLKTRFLFQLPYMYYHSYNRPLHAYLSAKPSQSWLWHNSKHTITSTYDARTLVLFNSKIIHPKQSDSNTSSSIQQPHFYHLRHGVTYPKQWVQQRLLADSLMRDKNIHKKYCEC